LFFGRPEKKFLPDVLGPQPASVRHFPGKTATQTHSRTQNCKYLTEITHDNPAWINTATAGALGIADGDQITLTRSKELFNDMTQDPAQAMGTAKSTMTVEAKVTDAIHPGTIAISHHLGHWAYGRYASGKAHPLSSDADQTTQASGDPDTSLIWWTKTGYRGNWIIPNAGDPISGAHRVFDAVVKIKKA
jgi:thiosulfate reductase/polysulfide reductase chain A